jgi:hypothetical protein
MPPYFTLFDSLTLTIFCGTKDRNHFTVALQTNSGLGYLMIDVSRSNADTHSAGLLCNSDQLVTEAAMQHTTITKEEHP